MNNDADERVMAVTDHDSSSTPSTAAALLDRDAHPLGVALVERAETIYHGVVADPKTFGPRSGALLAEARASGHQEALIIALRAQAWFERAHLNNSAAKALLDDAVLLSRQAGLDSRLHDILLTRSAVNQELGRLTQAQRDLDAAVRLINMSGGVPLMFQQAVLHHNLGRLREAAALYRQVLAVADVGIDLKGKAANNLSIIEIQWGHPDAAFLLVDQGAELARQVGPALAAVVASTRAWITTQTGRLTDGLAQFSEAARLHVDAELPLTEYYLEYVDALADLRLIPEALVIADRAAAEFQRQDAQLMAAEGLVRVGQLAALRGDTERAMTAAVDARRRFVVQRRAGWRARVDVLIGEIGLASGANLAGALTTTLRAAVALERFGMTGHAVEAHLTAGRIALLLNRRAAASAHLNRAGSLARTGPVLVRLKGRLALALAAPSKRSRLAHCRAGLHDLAEHRAAFASIELRIRASGHGAELGQIGLASLLGDGKPAQILSWMELTRAAALVAVDPIGDIGLDDDLAALRLVQGELMEARRGGGDEPTGLLVRQRTIEDRIRRLTWAARGSATVSGSAEELPDLRRALDGRTLVEYGVSDGQVFAVVVDQRRARLVPLSPVADVQMQVQQLLFALRRLCMRTRSAAATNAAMAGAGYALAQLAELLITPLALPADAPLVVSPSGALTRVPWTALASTPVSVVPAASFWRRTSVDADNPGSVLLVAGPDLPGAVDEVHQLAGLHPDAQLLEPPDSTIDAVVAGLQSVDLAHMACHGTLRADNPAFSSLRLHDGSLTLHEMDIRHVAPHRMVIAACESAVDTVFEGNEVLGFVSALMARGTSGLIASIVVVPDAASVPLMTSLHAGIRTGKQLNTALFAARSQLDRHDPHDFVNWCAFNAYGAA